MSRKTLVNILLLVQLIGTFGAIIKPRQFSHGTVTRRFPHQVSLRAKENSKHFCGGAILSERWILTAAQCTQGSYSSPKNVYIVAGASLLSNSGLSYDLDKIVNHHEFNWEKRANDISMLRTDRSLQILDYSIFPINLPSFKVDYQIEHNNGLTSVILSGWGTIHSKQSAEDEDYFEELQFQESFILDRKSCRRHLGHVAGKYLSDKHLCTSIRNGEGMCIGDIGSPLISENGEIVGIESWRGSACELGYPDVHTRVYPHLKWIWGNLIDTNNV